MARGPAQRGKRLDPSQMVPTTPKTGTRVYVCGPKPLFVGHRILHAGVEVPGAAEWTRIEAWVNARSVRELKVDEDFIPFETFSAEWDLAHPETVPAK